MPIPRNPRLEAPSKEAILGSGLLTNNTTIVYAYRGTEPSRNIHLAPQGLLLLLTEGVAFLASGEKAISILEVVRHFTNDVPNQRVPFGGVFTALMNGARRFSYLDRETRESLEQSCSHPDTLVVPYVEIVETIHRGIGTSGVGRRHYVMVAREDARREREHYCITPANAEIADALLALRFAAEKRTITVRLLREQTDFRGIQLAVLQKYRSQFPSTLWDHRAEMAAEIMERANSQLSQHGSSLAHLDATVLDQLSHFRVLPQFAKYFEVPTQLPSI